MDALRSHYYRPVRADNGDLIRNCVVTLLVPGTQTQHTGPVYNTATGTSQLSSQWHSLRGTVDFYLDIPAVLDIHIRPLDPGVPEQVWEAQGCATSETSGTSGTVSSVQGQSGDVNLIASDFGAMVSTGLTQIVVMDQTEYDATYPHDPSTLYLIRDYAGGAI